MNILKVEWATWKALVDNRPVYLAHIWQGGTFSQASYNSVTVLAGYKDVILEAKFISGSSEDTEWLSNYLDLSTETVTREDAAGIILGHKTPKFYSYALTTSSSGDNIFDLSTGSDIIIRGYQIQINASKFGDTIKIQFRSDGTDVPRFGALDTVVNDFGTNNPPLGGFANGWTARHEELDSKIGGSFRLSPGLKITLIYNATDATGRNIAIDLVTQL